MKTLSTKRQSQSAQAAALIKKILKKEYPNIKFSVKSDNYANGSSVRVSWTDGVPEKNIESFINQFQYGTFDGMTDCYNCDNVKDMPQAKYCFTNRRISTEKREIIRKQLAEKMGIADSEDAIVPNDYIVNTRGYLRDAPLRAAIYHITKDYDFTKGFHGVRNKYSTQYNQEISNLFELY